MSEFDTKAGEWDKSVMHRERAGKVAEEIIRRIPLSYGMRALEFGAGTGLLSFNLRERLGSITLTDNSEGMIRILREKVSRSGATNMHIVAGDLTADDHVTGPFDLIYTLMVLHHVDDTERVLGRFSKLLKSGGYLAIADIYSEDGSFHGHGFNGHKGFDAGMLAARLEGHGFGDVSWSTVYTIDKITSANERKQFDVFLMTARKK